jgi:putative nucleotidyltransferase with HDIG domain
MNSLKIKILGLTTVMMVIAVSLTAWHNLETQKAMLSQVATRNGLILGETIRNSIITDMANGQSAKVSTILGKIKKGPAIKSVRIFDETGRILNSAELKEIGDPITSIDLFAYRSKKLSFTHWHKGQECQITTVPIYNAPTCHKCHDKTKHVLGILNVHLSLSDLDTLQKKGREATLLSSATMLFILILTITAFILVYVDAPIRKLVAAMNQVEQGNFEKASVSVQNTDEMALLTSKFNLMVKRLKNLIETKLCHEREIAVTQEKLAHHEKIQYMNTTLEERLKEIEYLNITLKERIQEIEGANYKIADLASALEDKNTTLEQAVNRLSALYKMGLAINSTMDLERLFDLLIRKTTVTLNARIGYILLLDKNSSVLKIGGAVGIPDHIDNKIQIPLKAGGVSHWVIENRQPRLLRGMDDAKDLSRISRLGFIRKTVICAPLIVKDEVIGTITVANKLDESAFTLEDLELLSIIAAQASIAIKNARLYEEQQTTYLGTVQALVSAIEANDAYTRGHSERVTRYSLALTRRIGLPADAAKSLEHAAILHDIGKIGIDVTLLHKKEKLSAADIEILRRHPIIGGRILEPINFLKRVQKIIEQHHERFDGKGYPYGISGKNLLIESRILAVADAYDAMTTDRPYRKALSREAAIKEIENQAGLQFDPQVVKAFVCICKEGSIHGPSGIHVNSSLYPTSHEFSAKTWVRDAGS